MYVSRSAKILPLKSVSCIPKINDLDTDLNALWIYDVYTRRQRDNVCNSPNMLGCYAAQETEFTYNFLKALKQCPLKIWMTYAVILCIPKMSWILITI